MKKRDGEVKPNVIEITSIEGYICNKRDKKTQKFKGRPVDRSKR